MIALPVSVLAATNCKILSNCIEWYSIWRYFHRHDLLWSERATLWHEVRKYFLCDVMVREVKNFFQGLWTWKSQNWFLIQVGLPPNPIYWTMLPLLESEANILRDMELISYASCMRHVFCPYTGVTEWQEKTSFRNTWGIR